MLDIKYDDMRNNMKQRKSAKRILGDYIKTHTKKKTIFKIKLDET